MRRYLCGLIFLIGLIALPGCALWDGSNVEGYDELDAVLTPTEKARKDLLDAAGSYLILQEVLKQAKVNPQVGDDFKSGIETVDREMTNALVDYRMNLSASPDVLAAQMQTVIQVLQRANLLVAQYLSSTANTAVVNSDFVDVGSALLEVARRALANGNRDVYLDAMRKYRDWLDVLSAKHKVYQYDESQG